KKNFPSNVRLPGCVNLPVLVPERLVVTGADEPVCAHAGEDVTLSCSVDTHVNVTELQLKWIKTDDDGDILVLLYDDGENRPESQDERYSRRAEFYTEEIPKGNFSVKLRKVRTEDKGEFRCEVHSDTDSASTTARIAALGESPGHLHKVSHRANQAGLRRGTGQFSMSRRGRQGPTTQTTNPDPGPPGAGCLDPAAIILWRGTTALSGSCSAVPAAPSCPAVPVASSTPCPAGPVAPAGPSAPSIPVNVHLDPSTAHPKLIISGDWKSVRLGENRQTFPENSLRFDHVVNVLGKESFSSGRHYWEVEVKHKTDWTLGVAKRTVSRKGTLLIRPDAGFWTIILKDGIESPVLLSLRETPQKVGVYVDYGRGQVSFYSVDSRTHIFSFSGYNFTEELHPLLRPGLTDYGKNTSPLIITPIDVHQK
uniref:B30.2/SPRY domain-containing protein n=1 Tax=Paramormyrops kingsleyae TaxID=1676925 RepID=A0A3B3QZB9_9TELE